MKTAAQSGPKFAEFGSEYSIEVFPPGGSINPESSAAVAVFFSSEYYSYHYLDELTAPDRYRLVVLSAAGVVGYATLKIIGKSAFLSNLLVRKDHRGKGIGSIIDQRRAALCVELCLCPYSSCVTVGRESQRLKRGIGMQPINLRIGYRIGVFDQNDVSSAVTYMGKLIDGVVPVNVESVASDLRTRRIRYTVNSLAALRDMVARHSRDDAYVEALCSPGLKDAIENGAGIEFAGADVDFNTSSWGFLYQVKNPRYENGLKGRLDLLDPKSVIINNFNDYIKLNNLSLG